MVVEKSVLGIKIVLLVATVGLSCSMPLGEQYTATAVEVDSGITETPPEDPSQQPQQRSTHQSANTDGLILDRQQEIRQLSPRQLAATSWEGASFPLENFQTYTSAFGYREAPTGGYSQEFHYGLDMAAPEQSYIRNWWSGVVKAVSDDTACGTSVVVQSGNWTATYCHMQGCVETKDKERYMLDPEDGLKIQAGQQVAAGTRIGRVGMTGRTTGPHLHWTLKYADNYVDPGYVLRAMYQSQSTSRTPE